MITQEEVRERLRQAVAASGSQAAYAREKQIGQAYLSDALSGKRLPGEKILQALGLERVVSYREKGQGDAK